MTSNVLTVNLTIIMRTKYNENNSITAMTKSTGPTKAQMKPLSNDNQQLLWRWSNNNQCELSGTKKVNAEILMKL